jgi:hypothetical protein
MYELVIKIWRHALARHANNRTAEQQAQDYTADRDVQALLNGDTRNQTQP